MNRRNFERVVPRTSGEQQTSRLLVLMSAVYAAVLWYCYQHVIPESYESFGSGLHDTTAAGWIFSIVLILVPAAFLPTDVRRPSALLVHIQYWLIYVPACLLLRHTSRPELEPRAVVLVLGMVFVGMLVLIAASRAPRLRIALRRLPEGRYDALVKAAFLVLLLLVALTLGGNFRLAGLLDIYDLRAQAVEETELAGSRVGLYTLMWLSGAAAPLLFARALELRSRLWAAAALGSYVLLFGVAGHKSMLAALVLLPAVALLSSGPASRLALAMPVSLTSLLLLGLPLVRWFADTAGLLFTAVIYSRTFSVPALALAQYVEFFRNNPLTHLSHVKPFSLLLTYPFDDDLPFVVGRYYYDFPIGLNAGLWAGDGIASFGLGGILVASVVGAAVLWTLDCAAQDLSPRRGALSIAFIAMSFTNISIFTTMWSGGLLFVMAALLFAPRARVVGRPVGIATDFGTAR